MALELNADRLWQIWADGERTPNLSGIFLRRTAQCGGRQMAEPVNHGVV